MGGTVSHATITELGKQNCLYKNGKSLNKAEKNKHQARLHSQLTKH
jgi:hypothetical protein